jgi:hypothetical protein
MYLCYYDESGDDGYPIYSSRLFILSSIYMYYLDWQDNYKKINQFKRDLNHLYGFPYSQEMHFKEFLQDKNPYHQKYDINSRKIIVEKYFKLISDLNIKIINVVIDKNKIKNDSYPVLETALTYSVQRIENSLRNNSSDSKFLIITDEGRVGKMRTTNSKNKLYPITIPLWYIQKEN